MVHFAVFEIRYSSQLGWLRVASLYVGWLLCAVLEPVLELEQLILVILPLLVDCLPTHRLLLSPLRLHLSLLPHEELDVSCLQTTQK